MEFFTKSTTLTYGVKHFDMIVVDLEVGFGEAVFVDLKVVFVL